MSQENRVKLIFEGQQEDEVVIWQGNQHPFVLLKPGLIFAVVFLAGMFVLFYGQFQQWAWLAAVILILVAAGFFGRFYFCWKMSQYILTSKRVVYIQRRGIFSKTEAQAPLERIQDVILETSGLAATIFKFGNVKIQTAGTEKVLELPLMNNPRQFQQKMMTRLNIER